MKLSNFGYRLPGIFAVAAPLLGCAGAHPAIIPPTGSDSAVTHSAPPTSILSGETFSSARVHRSCHWFASSIESWTVKFRATGVADGSFPGTFTARGSINRTTQRSVTHYSFHESFDIVYGSKHLFGNATGGQNFSVTCDHSRPNQSGFSVSNASFKTRRGRAYGTTSSTLSGLGGSSFSESFQ